jgi:hypothetical protein
MPWAGAAALFAGGDLSQAWRDAEARLGVFTGGNHAGDTKDFP